MAGFEVQSSGAWGMDHKAESLYGQYDEDTLAEMMADPTRKTDPLLAYVWKKRRSEKRKQLQQRQEERERVKNKKEEDPFQVEYRGQWKDTHSTNTAEQPPRQVGVQTTFDLEDEEQETSAPSTLPVKDPPPPTKRVAPVLATKEPLRLKKKEIVEEEPSLASSQLPRTEETSSLLSNTKESILPTNGAANTSENEQEATIKNEPVDTNDKQKSSNPLPKRNTQSATQEPNPEKEKVKSKIPAPTASSASNRTSLTSRTTRMGVGPNVADKKKKSVTSAARTPASTKPPWAGTASLSSASPNKKPGSSVTSRKTPVNTGSKTKTPKPTRVSATTVSRAANTKPQASGSKPLWK